MQTSDLFEMAKPAATCDKCGKGPIHKTHYWYKGAWKCKGAGKAAPSEEKKVDDKPTETDKTSEATPTRATSSKNAAAHAANEKAANDRQTSFLAQLRKERGIKDDEDNE